MSKASSRIERHVRGDLQVVQQQRVAVGRAARDAAGGDGGAAAADVLDDEVLPELLGKSRRQHARELIGRAAGRVGHDDGDGAARIVLRRAAAEREQTAANAAAKRGSASCADVFSGAYVLRNDRQQAGRASCPGGEVQRVAAAEDRRRPVVADRRAVKGPTPFIG